MFSKIMIPLDGSSLAERALPMGVKFAEGTGGKLILYRVVPYFTVLAADPLLYEEMNRLGEDEALAYLRQIRKEVTSPLPTETICEVGSAAESILQYASDSDVDLIVMSSHGRSGLNRWVYGSVAERIMSQAPCPTLILNARHPTSPGAPEKILIPLDGSQLAEKALEPALELVSALGLKLHLLRVTTSGHMRIETDTKSDLIDGIESDEVVEAQNYLQGLSQRIAVDDVQLSVEVAKATVAETIIEYAAKNNIDLIAMSSHGHTGLKRWVYGSVAEKVLRGACCATMIVRNN
jgi:nucleotide-binding universal stress UspA family protein